MSIWLLTPCPSAPAGPWFPEGPCAPLRPGVRILPLLGGLEAASDSEPLSTPGAAIVTTGTLTLIQKSKTDASRAALHNSCRRWP